MNIRIFTVSKCLGIALLLITPLLIAPLCRAGDILYFTDLEGSRERMDAFYQSSGGFTLGSDNKYHIKDGMTVIYGGDAPDRYYGSLGVIDELVRLHEESPTQMFSLAGNRDINKMRLTSELSSFALNRPPQLRDYTPGEAYAAESELPPDRTRRFKYILANTMGAREAFELIRKELAVREAKDLSQITDDHVTDEYLAYLKPGGNLAKLLGHMKLGLHFGNTIFVHGGLTPENIPSGVWGELPVDEWLTKLNGWYAEQYQEWIHGYLRWNGFGPRAAEALLEYPMPKVGALSKPESVVTGRHVDLENNPLSPAGAVIAYLQRQNIQREIIGHTPMGDMAVIVRHLSQSFESVFVDNSFSTVQARPMWVRLIGPKYRTVVIEGSAKVDGEWRVVRAVSQLDRPSVVGRRLEDGSRVLGQDPQGNWIATRMEKFKILNRVVSCEQELKLQGK